VIFLWHSAIGWPIIEPRISKIVAAVDEAKAESFVAVKCGYASGQACEPKEPEAG
jgi:hypothetical protein